MSFLTLGWLISFLRRWIRSKRIHTATVPVVPSWPRGVSFVADFHDFRGFRHDSPEMPNIVSLTLRHDGIRRKVFDQFGRELVSVQVRTNGLAHVRQTPDAMLRALATEILAGGMVTLLLIETYMPNRGGLVFVDATCVSVEPASRQGLAVA